MASSYSAKAVANYFLDIADRESKPLDPMQIQKLVYIAHGWYLALEEVPLIRESVEAWRFGPVIADLYHEFKKFGKEPIEGRATEFKFEWFEDRNKDVLMRGWLEQPSIEESTEDSSATKLFLNRVWDVYKRFTGVQLANLTHEPGTPWDEVRKENPNKKSVSIPDDVIKDYYLQRLAENAGTT